LNHKNKIINMKTKLLLSLAGMFILLFSTCLPVDEDPNPDDPNAKFLGTWSVSETCNRMNYDVEIVNDPGNSAQVLLYNFGNPGTGYDPAVGLVVSNTIHVSSQNIGEGWTVNGTGTYLTNGTISWVYDLAIPPNNYSCTATFSK
jgi:hypothetical protein